MNKHIIIIHYLLSLFVILYKKNKLIVSRMIVYGIVLHTYIKGRMYQVHSCIWDASELCKLGTRAISSRLRQCRRWHFHEQKVLQSNSNYDVCLVLKSRNVHPQSKFCCTSWQIQIQDHPDYDWEHIGLC